MDRNNGWNCDSCGSVLGNVNRDELFVSMENVSTVHTLTGSLLIRCKCGRIKTWFTRPDVGLYATLKTLIRASNDEVEIKLRELLDEYGIVPNEEAKNAKNA